MKKLLCIVAVLAMAFAVTAGAAPKGPLPDKVYMNVKMSQEIGLKDTAEGLTDIFFYGVDGPAIVALDQATRDKMDLYVVPGGSWSLLFNPIPNKAPYTWKVEDKEYFNPFAIREVRFAMNYLINRKYIVDEILLGTGSPAFTMATTGQPGTYKYNLLAQRMGFTDEGDEPRAIADITAALENAAALPELKGRLAKSGDWWTFDNEPVTIKFLIRVDDPQGRLKEGHYVADLIEKVGIKVDRLLWDRSKCGTAVYGGDPAAYEWHLYTEGWGSGATRAWWEHIVAQMYAPWYGYMPGGGVPEFWNYTNDEIDEYTQKAYTGNFLTTDEYWEFALKGLEGGLNEAVRIYVANQNQYFAANKARFNNRMLYGMGDGLNEWSLISANTKDNIVKITGFSAKGNLFMHAWDPIGEDGMTDVYTHVAADPTGMQAMFESPATAINTPYLVDYKDLETQVERNAEGEVVGKLPVPADATKYDSAQNKWVKVGEGVTAMSKATYTMNFGKWHHGIEMELADFIYTDAFQQEWAFKDSDDDRYFDAPYGSAWEPGRKTFKGMVVNADNTITNYFDYNFPASEPRTASWGAPTLGVASGRPGYTFAWEIYEALAHLVAEGSASGTEYSFVEGQLTEVDMLVPDIVADIKAKLVEFKEKKYVPDSIKDFITPEHAVERYEAAIKWIDEKGHAVISCGPFYIEKYDPSSNFMELTAFRDEAYQYTADYWPAKLATVAAQIDNADIPPMFAVEEKTMPVKIYVSEMLYPEGTTTPTEKAKVNAMLITPTEELTYDATYVEPGVFEVAIPVEGLEAGSYTILLNAEIEGAVPAATAGSTVLY